MARSLYAKHEGFEGKAQIAGPFDNIPQVRAFARRLKVATNKTATNVVVLREIGTITVEANGAGSKITKEEVAE